MAGFWSRLLASAADGSGGTAMFTPRVTHLGASEFAAAIDPSSLTAASMWETQPHFRTVVDFLARNVAQLGVHVFERGPDGDRTRSRSDAASVALREVDGSMTTYDLVYALVGDLALYDRAYWWAAPSSETASGFMLRRLPPTWVEPVMADAWTVKHYLVYITSDAQPTEVPAEHILPFTGYAPGRADGASPTVDALRSTLQEQIEAAKYRSQVWRRGGRVAAVIERPKEAPAWTDDQASRFREDWYSNYTGDGPRAGGTPILEDGMTLKQIQFNAKEQQYVEAARLSLTTVASAFHVNPTMLGHNEGANYSNVREFRKMLYGDTLGPMVARIEARINTFLMGRLGLDPARFYVEFNIGEKLQGNFEEQAAQLQTSTGGPFMTRNEARGMLNLSKIEGGDELIVPLNVIEGGQASPTDSGTQNERAPMGVLVKAAKATEHEIKAVAEDELPEEHVDPMRDVFTRHFARQRAAVTSSTGAKAADWWDGDRWDTELAADLLEASLKVSTAAALGTLAELGISTDEYSTERTRAFLAKVSERISGQVNATTLAQLEEAMTEDGAGVAHVFDVAEDSRATQSATTAAATVVGFGLVEAARQTRPAARKRWQVNSGSPRNSHASLNGEEVGIDDVFSNGLPWPGSFGGDVDEIAGCQCSVVVIT